MKDGFYLSVYVNPVGLQRLANVTYRHDNNVSLWHKNGRDVRLIAHWEIERLSGQKQHRTPFFDRAHLVDFMQERLAEYDLALDDMVEIWGTPDIDTVDNYHLVGDYPQIAYHALAHLYSAILLDTEKYNHGTTVGFAVDRGPEFVLERDITDKWFAGCVIRDGKISIFPTASPAPLYGAAKDRFHQREGTLMALATATKAHGTCDRQAIVDNYTFDDIGSLTTPAEALERIIDQVQQTLVLDPQFSAEDSLVSAVMQEVQAISVAIMEKNVDAVLAEYDIDPTQSRLALAGGYALNCPTNSHLMNSYGFSELVAPPCVGDDGQSIGIALAAFAKKCGADGFDFRFPTAYLGGIGGDLDAALREHAGFVQSTTPIDDATMVADLQAGPVIWFNGRSEIGPRALGNRSLIADPTTYRSKELLNDYKQRQWWRPVAPVALDEHLDTWFENSRPSPYMLETFTIREEARERIPAVAHLDYSARVQSVTAEQNPELHRLLSAFHTATGVPMLCNTSLNDAGEPIIERIDEAINFALRKRISVVYANGQRIELGNFDAYAVDGPLPRDHTRFTTIQEEQAHKLSAELNPFGIPALHLHHFLHDFTLIDRFDITTEDGAAAALRAVEEEFANNPQAKQKSERRYKERGTKFSSLGAVYTF
ncbi:carbamoyltransferase C-terminal domain-containing protein [Streptomyces sp. NPDC007094]|uniref:carbamoyltransferase C-terminal domain-containing protein n=1 Tax=Streptomyces sp. NPDC007094 TaxID=3155359 RepID=UPI0033E364D8